MQLTVLLVSDKRVREIMCMEGQPKASTQITVGGTLLQCLSKLIASDYEVSIYLGNHSLIPVKTTWSFEVILLNGGAKHFYIYFQNQFEQVK